MVGDGDAPPRARLRPGLVVALVVATVIVVGIAGLFAVALFGDDDEPTGAGLEQQVDVAAPATASAAERTGEGGSSPTDDGGSSTGEPGVAAATGTTATGRRHLGDAPSTTAAAAAFVTVEPVNELATPPSDADAPDARYGAGAVPVARHDAAAAIDVRSHPAHRAVGDDRAGAGGMDAGSP